LLVPLICYKIKNIMLHHLRELRVTIRLPLLFILGRVSCNFANAAHCYLLDFVNFALYHFQPISTRHSFHLMSKYVNTKNVSQNYSVLFWRSLVAKLTHVHFMYIFAYKTCIFVICIPEFQKDFFPCLTLGQTESEVLSDL
jgi:hypothetical protein